ncbi:MAG: DUF1573 domain-containing protein [Rikenellaceae bacterium]|nr:DUF1573 domain-containing protein [Rikenellaceae bacterium]
MKSVAHIIIVVAVATLAIACGGTQKRVEYAGQVVTFTDSLLTSGVTDTLHFGRMHSGEIAVKTLALENSTSEPLVILRHETTCHCATITYTKQPLMPGSRSEIRFEFDSRGEHGWQMKLANFYIAGAERPLRVFIEAEIE